mgnify:CR=1 FL=1
MLHVKYTGLASVIGDVNVQQAGCLLLPDRASVIANATWQTNRDDGLTYTSCVLSCVQVLPQV